jgi:carboxymethylenebutenolidase
MTTTLETSDGAMDLYVAGDPATARAAVVVIQEAFGVTTHIQRCADRIAHAGYLAVAPALFHRTGSPTMAYDDFANVMPHMEALSAEGVTMDLAAVAAHLEALGFGAPSRGIVGFCMGGLVAFVGATTGSFGAAVTFYGGGVAKGRFGFPPLLELAPSITCPWLGCYGDLDKGIPVEEVEQLREITSALPIVTEVVRYADADHGFNCEDRPAVYNPSAASDAWARMLAFFGEHLASRR